MTVFSYIFPTLDNVLWQRPLYHKNDFFIHHCSWKIPMKSTYMCKLGLTYIQGHIMIFISISEISSDQLSVHTDQISQSLRLWLLLWEDWVAVGPGLAFIRLDCLSCNNSLKSLSETNLTRQVPSKQQASLGCQRSVSRMKERERDREKEESLVSCVVMLWCTIQQDEHIYSISTTLGRYWIILRSISVCPMIHEAAKEKG